MGLRRIPRQPCDHVTLFSLYGEADASHSVASRRPLPNPSGAAALRDFARITCLVYRMSLSRRPILGRWAPASAATEQEFWGPVSVPEPSRDRDIQEQLSPRGRARPVRAPPRVL